MIWKFVKKIFSRQIPIFISFFLFPLNALVLFFLASSSNCTKKSKSNFKFNLIQF